MAACQQVFHPAAGPPGTMVVSPRNPAPAAAVTRPAGGAGEPFRGSAGRRHVPPVAVRRTASPHPTPVPDRMVAH